MHVIGVDLSSEDTERDPTDDEIRKALDNVLARKNELNRDAIAMGVVYEHLRDRIKQFVENPKPNFFESTGFFAGNPVLVLLFLMQQTVIQFQRLEEEHKVLFQVNEKDGKPVYIDEPLMQLMNHVIQTLGRVYEHMEEAEGEDGNEGADGGGGPASN